MQFIGSVLENAKKQLLNEKERQIAIVRNRISQEIAPKYNEIDKIRNESLNGLTVNFDASKNALTEQYNNQIIALQKNYEEEKNNVILDSEKKKKEMFSAMLTKETYEIDKKFEKAIAMLDNGIEDNNE